MDERTARNDPDGGPSARQASFDHRLRSLRAILEGFPELVFVMDAEDRFVEYYGGDTRDLAAPPEVFLGQRVDEVLPPDPANRLMSASKRARSTGETQTVTYDLALGEREATFEATIRGMESGDVLFAIRNVTERRIEQRRLERAARLLETVTDVQNAFIGGADREDVFLQLLDVFIAETGLSSGAFFERGRASDTKIEVVVVQGADAPGGGEPVLASEPLGKAITAALGDGAPAWWADDTGKGHWLAPLRGKQGQIGAVVLCGYAAPPDAETLGPLLVTSGTLLDAARSERSRARAEQELADRENRLQLVLQSTRDGIFDWNLVTDEMQVSKQLLAHIGYTPAELDLTFDIWRDLLHPEDLETTLARLEEHLRDHEVRYEIEYRMRHKDGSWRWIEARGRVVERTPDGRPVRMLGSLRDVTERKQVDLALEESEERFRALADLAPIGIFRAGPDGPVDYLNTRWFEITGVPIDEAMGEGWRAAIHPDDQHRVFVAWSACVDNGSTMTEEFRMVRPDGGSRLVRVRARPVPGPSGPQAFVGAIEDVTDLRGAEQRVRDAYASLRAVIDQALDGIVTFDTDGEVISANAALARMTGYAIEELVGTSIENIVPGLSSLDGGTSAGHTEQRAVHRDGSEFPVEVGLTDLRRDGELQRLGLVRDIRARKRVERLKDEFVSTVSHELRTPLTSIHGALKLLDSGAVGSVDPAAKRLLNMAVNNTERLSRLVHDVLDVGRIDAGRMPLRVSTHRILPLADAAAATVAGPAAKRDVTITVEARDDDTAIRVDADAAVRVLTNLISNAVKWSPDGGAVTARWRRDGEFARIEVLDSGPGVPPDQRARIFERFVQVDTSDARQRGGTGLGLSIARSLTEMMGGRIGVESRDGGGSVFYVELPLAR